MNFAKDSRNKISSIVEINITVHNNRGSLAKPNGSGPINPPNPNFTSVLPDVTIPININTTAMKSSAKPIKIKFSGIIINNYIILI